MRHPLPLLLEESADEVPSWRGWLLPAALALLLHGLLLWLMLGDAHPPSLASVQQMSVSLVRYIAPGSDAQPRAQRVPVRAKAPPAAKPKPITKPKPRVHRARPAARPEPHRVKALTGPRSPEMPLAEAEIAADTAAQPEGDSMPSAPADSEARYRTVSLHNPAPHYPHAARRRGIEGRVVLNVEVLAEGACGRIEVLHSSGHEMLDDAALAAVSRWHFLPATHAGLAVTRWLEVPIRFELRGSTAE